MNVEGLTFKVMTVTPEQAKAWLEKSEPINFRAQRPGRVTRYAKDMIRLRWHLNGAPIVFDNEGRVIDGRHRLRACVVGGVEFKTVIIRGIADRTALDTNLPRGFGQYLANEGVIHSSTTAAVIKLVHAWENQKLGVSAVVVSLDDLLDCSKKHRERLISVVRCALRVREVCSPTVPAAVVHIGCLDVSGPEIPTLGREFLEGLGLGANLDKDDARLLLRTQLLADRTSKTMGLGLLARRAKIILAWNRYTRGLQTKRQNLNYSPERMEFPEIYQIPVFCKY